MGKEKCFCHLNGYAVKDATARRDLQDLKEWKEEADQLLDYLEERETSNEADHINFRDTIIQLSDTDADHEDRITALEEGGGGGKIYRHLIKIVIPKSGTLYHSESYLVYYNPSPDPINTATKLSALNLTKGIPVNVQDFYYNSSQNEKIVLHAWIEGYYISFRYVSNITDDGSLSLNTETSNLKNEGTITDTVTEVI